MDEQKLLQENQSVSDELQHQIIVKTKQMLKSFFKGNIKTRASPFPIYCGCYSYKFKSIQKESFICARIISQDNKPHYYLYIATNYHQNICQAYDPEKIDIEMNIISLKDDEWVLLTTIIPETPLKRWEYLDQSIVLSLFQLEGGDWTYEFYPAKIINLPSRRKDEDIRGYELEFIHSSTRQIVPEGFVAPYLANWIKADQGL